MDEKELRIRGAPVSEGIAIGLAFFLFPLAEEPIPEFPISLQEVDGEIDRYRQAIVSSKEDLRHLLGFLISEGSSKDVSDIIEAHVLMLEDPLMTSLVEMRIRQMCKNTEAVFHSVIQDFKQRFAETDDSLFMQRIDDIQDLSKRVLNHLRRSLPSPLLKVPPHSVVFAHELSPSYIASVQSAYIAGFVTHSGGGNSHAALIARAKGIPYVSDINITPLQKCRFAQVIVDGGGGEVIFHPTLDTLKAYCAKKDHISVYFRQLEEETQLKAETSDGFAIRILANVCNLDDLEHLFERGAQGIGLFRSEYLFMPHIPFFPTEEEQIDIYRLLVLKARGKPVIIRVFDVGGDKNPQLAVAQGLQQYEISSYRGMRFLLRFEEIFKTQLRAILRVAEEGDVRILLPLISDVEELRKAKVLISEIQEKLGTNKKIPIGCMIEVPGAVMICDALAKEADFFSIGTNDLLQYSFGIDRSHDLVYPAHPSIVRMLKIVIAEANKHNIELSVCGEMAANPLYTPLLLGLGVYTFSCATRHLPLLNHTIREISLERAKGLAEEVLQKVSSAEISELLLKFATDS